MTFQEEPWADVWQEIAQYFQAHNDEAGDGPLNFDYPRYHFLAERGRLVVITARDPDIVGYHVSIIGRSGKTSQKVAAEDFYYMLPSHRGRFGGVRLVREARQILRARGVTRRFASVKDDTICRRLKMKIIETTYGEEL